VVESAIESVDNLIQKAFDRLDLSLLQAGMEARATIKQAEFSLRDVMDHGVDKLDSQQRKLVSQLQSFKRLIDDDAQKVLREIREEKNSVLSEIRLLVSNHPGAIRIIPKYAIEGTKHIEFQLLGTALSKVKFDKTMLNSRARKFTIVGQSDTQMIIRVPIAAIEMANLMRNAKGKPAEAIVSFEFVEYSWFDLVEADRRRFSAVAYVMPKKIGTAQATFSGKVEELIEKRKNITSSTGTFESSRTVGIGSVGAGRKRGKGVINAMLETDSGWKFRTSSAKFDLRYFKGGCNKRRVSAQFIVKNEHRIALKGNAATHLGHNSVCEVRVTLSAIQTKRVLKDHSHSLSTQTISTNHDVKFQMSANNLAVLKNARLDYVKVTSPLFENGTRYIKPGEGIGGLKLEYDPSSRTAILRFRYLQ